MQRIGDSELILTSTGHIYHLNLKPEELADTIITVGDPERVPMVSRYFDEVETRAQHREFVTHTGRIGAKRLSVLSTGIGPDNIDIVLNEIDALANIDCSSRMLKEQPQSLTVFRMGTAGSLQADVPVDSLVVSGAGIGLDNLMHFYKKPEDMDEAMGAAFRTAMVLADTAIHPYAFRATPSLASAFGADYHQGITVTCPGFYGPQGRVLRGGLAFPELTNQLPQFSFDGLRVVNFEMETSAIYGLCHLLGHRCLSINTIVANRISKTFTRNAAKSVDRMIRQSLEIICGL